MKIATVLSVSAFLAMFSVVACSSPATTDGGDEDQNDSASTKGDKDTKSTKDKTSTADNTNTATDTDTSTSTGATEATCQACYEANADFKKAATCAEAAKDDAAAEKCFEDIGCTEANQGGICAELDQQCESKCPAGDDDDDDGGMTEEEEQACITCAAKSTNAQVKAIEKCYNDAEAGNDDAAFDKCDDMFESKCDSACQAAYDKCGCK